MKQFVFLTAVLFLASALGCQNSKDSSEILSEVVPTSSSIHSSQWGPETPNFNLEVVLRDVSGGQGFGLVKFRQPNDGEFVVSLDTWVRNLEPNTSYRLQRAVDTTLDGVCTSEAWLTLGRGLDPQAITTDSTGTGREELWRAVPPSPGAEFDIHFQIIHDVTGAVVLKSDCYRYVVSL